MRNFKKIFLLYLTFFIFLSFQSQSEIVNKIKAQGNERVSLETIVIFGDINIGKNYESDDIGLIIKKLYETNFFANIVIELKDGVLNIKVVENPIINSVVFHGEKANKYKEAITDHLSLKESSSFVSNFVKSDINIIKEFYKQLGFYFVQIDADVEKLEQNRVNIVYTIDKGKKAKISKIFFLGDKKIRDKRLLDVITSQESKFWKFISKNVYLNQSRIELDKRLLKNYYKNKGYYEIQVASSNVEYSEGEGFVLTFTINAGKRYKFKKIFANISETLDQEAFVSLEKEFNKVIGDYYSERKLTKILTKIDELSEQKELQFINHSVSETLIDDGVEIQINVFEGEKFIVERINIVGNNVTNDSVIRSELIVDEGDPFSTLLINKSVNRLKARGIFGKIKTKISEGSSPDLKVLEINVEEKATGEIIAGAGVGTDGTSVMAAVTENNWLGRGIKLQSSINISQEKVRGDIYVNNPNFNYSGNAVYVGLDVSSLDIAETSGYSSSKTGFRAGTEFEQYENIYISPGFITTYEDIEVDSTASASVKKMDGTFYNMDFHYGITVDKRNQRFQPTEGYRTKFSQTIPIVMDSSSLLNGLDVSTYYDFSEDLIGSIKLYARSIHGVDEEDVRLTSRLFLPAKRLRGFQTGKTGPKDGDDYIGGNFATALGFEAQLPNLLPESTRTDVSLFLDTGNVWHVDYSDSVDDTNKIRSAIGVSANMYTTIGPLSFTLAQDLSKASNDKTETFNFRLGTSF